MGLPFQIAMADPSPVFVIVLPPSSRNAPLPGSTPSATPSTPAVVAALVSVSCGVLAPEITSSPVGLMVSVPPFWVVLLVRKLAACSVAGNPAKTVANSRPAKDRRRAADITQCDGCILAYLP